MNAKQFFYLSASILLLVIAYGLGASAAQGQAPNPTVAAVINVPGGAEGNAYAWVFTSNGDMYETGLMSSGSPRTGDHVYVGNIFSLPTVQVQDKSMSDVKSVYRK
jgi:hypothetical protein